MIRALFITTNAEGSGEMWHEDVEPDALYERIKKHIDGWLEAVRLDGGTMYLNEEGKLKRLSINEIATTVFRTHLGGEDHVVGNVVVVGPPDSECNDTSIDETMLDEFYKVIGVER